MLLLASHFSQCLNALLGLIFEDRRSEDRHSEVELQLAFECLIIDTVVNLVFCSKVTMFSLYSIFQILSDGFKLTDNVMEFVDHAVMNLNSVLSFPFIREFKGEVYNFCENDINEDCLSQRI